MVDELAVTAVAYDWVGWFVLLYVAAATYVRGVIPVGLLGWYVVQEGALVAGVDDVSALVI